LKRVYLYHATKKPKIFLEADIDKMKDKGWHISPIPFIKTTDFGVDPTDNEQVQMMGETILGVRDYMNDMLNLELMKVKELKDFVKRNFEDFNHKYRNKARLIQAIKDH